MRRRKNQKQIKIVIGLSICLLFIMSAGYAAFSTNLTLTAKGNIKETNAAWKLKKNIVSSGDGLYVDSYEEGRYIYRGQNPNNYLTFNGESWRIIAIEQDDSLKIILNNVRLGVMPWDTIDNRNNDNNTYCNRNTSYYGVTGYHGCSAWNSVTGEYTDGKNSGTVISNSTINTYLNNEFYNSLNEDKKNIIKYNFNIGRIGVESTKVFSDDEKKHKWNGLVGLINVSDFLKASTNEACDSYEASRSLSYPCTLEKGNYLDEFKSESWSINAHNFNSANPTASVKTIGAYFSDVKGGVSGNMATANYLIRPVVYLKSDIKLSGSGTKEDPYIIK